MADRTTPNPGSDEARTQGCRCPVLDNCRGRRQPRPDGWWVNANCPLHGAARETTTPDRPQEPPQ